LYKVQGQNHWTKKLFSNKWIEGADSVRANNIRGRAKLEQHMHAMNLEKKHLAQCLDESPASIAWALTAISKKWID